MLSPVSHTVDDQSPTRTPVRGSSHPRGHSENRFWRRTDRREVQLVLRAARRFDRESRSAGRRNGPLGHVAIEILELFVNLVEFRTGRLDPSLETIMRMIRRSRDAVVRALQALRRYGFLDWLRRYVPTGNEGRGPQVRQTSNAYRLALPDHARRLLGLWAAPVPVPDDAVAERRDRDRQIAEWCRLLSREERVRLEFGATPLGEALAKLARVFDRRESGRQGESRSVSFL